MKYIKYLIFLIFTFLLIKIDVNASNLIRSCSYGQYIIYYYSDGTYKALSVGENSNHKVTFDPGDTKDAFKLYCPSKVYVKVTGGRGDYSDKITLTSETDSTSIALTSGKGEDTGEEDPILPIDEVNICDPEGGALKAFQIIGYLLYIVKLVIPLILIILGSIDFAKSVISSDDKAPQKALQQFATRIIIAVIIFILPTVLDFLLSLVDGTEEAVNDEKKGFGECTTCLFNPLSSDCKAKDFGE